MMKKKNMIAAVLFIALAVFVWITSADYVPKLAARFSANQLANDFFPKLVAAVMAGLAILLVVQTAIAKPGSAVIAEDEEEKPSFKEKLMPAIGLAILLLYLLLIESLGFVLDTAWMIIAFLALFRSRNWKYYLITPLIGSLGIYLLFTKVFLVILPRGILPL